MYGLKIQDHQVMYLGTTTLGLNKSHLRLFEVVLLPFCNFCRLPQGQGLHIPSKKEKYYCCYFLNNFKPHNYLCF